MCFGLTWKNKRFVSVFAPSLIFVSVLSVVACKTVGSKKSAEVKTAGLKTDSGDFHYLYTFPSNVPKEDRKVCYEICPGLGQNTDSSASGSFCKFVGYVKVKDLPSSSLLDSIVSDEFEKVEGGDSPRAAEFAGLTDLIRSKNQGNEVERCGNNIDSSTIESAKKLVPSASVDLEKESKPSTGLSLNAQTCYQPVYADNNTPYPAEFLKAQFYIQYSNGLTGWTPFMRFTTFPGYSGKYALRYKDQSQIIAVATRGEWGLLRMSDYQVSTIISEFNSEFNCDGTHVVIRPRLGGGQSNPDIVPPSSGVPSPSHCIFYSASSCSACGSRTSYCSSGNFGQYYPMACWCEGSRGYNSYKCVDGRCRR